MHIIAPIVTYKRQSELKSGASENSERFMKFREVISSDRKIRDFIRDRKSKKFLELTLNLQYFNHIYH